MNMKLLLKILKLTVSIIGSFSIILFFASLLLQDKVGDIVLNSLNSHLSTKLDVGSFRFSLLRKFPKASVELKDILVHPSPGFNPADFSGINTDTLLAAESASIEFRMKDILKGDYTIERIGIRSGKLNLFTDSAGLDNYNISWKEEKKSGEDVSLNLNRINLYEISSFYNDLDNRLIIKGIINDGRLKSRISGNYIDFDANSRIQIELFQLRNSTIKKSIPADVEVVLHKTDKGILFKKGILGIENWEFILTGFISSDNDLDLTVSGKNIDISKITNYFPDKYKNLVSEYHPSGILKIDSKIKGVSSRTSNPHFEIIYSLNNAHIDYGNSDLGIDNFSFDGSISNGAKNRPETSSFSIRNFTTTLGSAVYKGSFYLSDFTKRRAELILKGTVFPAELKKFLNLQNVARTEGSIDLDLKLSGSMEKKEKYKIIDIFDLNSESEVIFNSFGIELNNKRFDLEGVNGNILFSESTSTKNLQFVYNGQKIKLDGNFRNLPEWLVGKSVNLIASANLSASCLKPELFLNDSSASDEAIVKKAPVIFPDDVILDLNFNIDSLIYKSFSAEKVRGTLSYKPRLLDFKTLNLNSQKGSISGNGLIAQNSNKSFIGRGNFSLTNIDVNEAFTTFHNFGQDFLKAENIAGSLSGSLSVLLPVDSLLNPDMKSVTAEGKYLLTDGALINFDPVKELSSFIELSELENISFDQLENDFFIRNYSLYIPQMDVRSSAVDLTVNGKHGFDNNYEYHVKMYLSEILSKKARKNRTVSSEFGEVEDDGLGRTSVYLKIEGKGEDIKVAYDMKAAGNQIKNDIKKERQTLKTILNEEYGWYKKDTPAEEKSTSKPRFKITWEGSDTIRRETEPPPVKKESVIKKLFKKK